MGWNCFCDKTLKNTMHFSQRTSQVTYVTMFVTMSPRGNETLRPLGVAIGECRQCDPCLKHTYIKTPPVGRRQPMTSLPARPRYKGRWENTSFTSSSEACIRSMAHSLGDAVSHSPSGKHGYIRNLRRSPSWELRTASPRGRYWGTLYPRHHAEGNASQFRAKGEH